MSDYTYSLPFSNDRFMKGIIMMLKKENKYDPANLLRGANVQVEKGTYSYYDGGWGRSNALAAYVTFFVNPEYLDILDSEENKKTLDKICSGLIPPDVGFDIKSVSFNMDLTKDFELEDDLISDLENNVNSKAYKIMGELLPEDIRTKGYQMAEAYTYLYSVESSLRLFIEKVAKEKYGEDYFPSQSFILPKLMVKRELIKNELSSWFGDYYEQLQIAATYNLIINAATMVKSGVGVALCFDLGAIYDDDLCFIPLNPALKTGSVLVWKKNQTMGEAVTHFIRSVKNAF